MLCFGAQAAPASGHHHAPCSVHSCKAKIVLAPGQVTRWQSPQRMKDGSLMVYLSIKVNGHELPNYTPTSSCRATASGHRVALELSICRHGAAPLVLNAADFGDAAKTVRLAWRMQR